MQYTMEIAVKEETYNRLYNLFEEDERQYKNMCKFVDKLLNKKLARLESGKNPLKMKGMKNG